jgi:hypothetical protein
VADVNCRVVILFFFIFLKMEKGGVFKFTSIKMTLVSDIN